MIAMPLLVGGVILIAALIAALLVLRSRQRWAWPLAAGQMLAAALLYVFLFPPQGQQGSGTLTILTPGISGTQLEAVGTSTRTIALPGIATDVDARIERAPDLATALRRHPDAASLRIIGNGLPSRDRAVARGRAIEFDAAPLADGIVELAMPARVQVGNRWRASGRIHAATLANRTIELRDPSDAVAATAKTNARGEFQVDGVANAIGLLRYQLSLRDDDGKVTDELPLTLDARASAPLRVLLLAAVPTPELKYLRRWAEDAGLVVDVRIGLSEGIALRDGDQPLIDAAALSASDLLVVDERSWSQLDAPTRVLVSDAVHGGLGLLLRVTSALTPEMLTDWAALGIALEPGDPSPPAAFRDDVGEDSLALTQLPYRAGPQLATLIASRDGDAVVAWHAQGRGRIGVTTIADSYRYVLAGSPDRHGSLWATIATTLGRARAEAEPSLPMLARAGERVLICGLDGAGWEIEDRKATRTALLVDQESSACAAFWPAEAGMHRLTKSAGAQPSNAWSFNVLAADQGTALFAAQTQAATRSLVTSTAPSSVDMATRIPRAAWFLAWLLVMTMLWWVERRLRQSQASG